MVSISKLKRNLLNDENKMKYIIYHDMKENQEYYREVKSNLERDMIVMTLNALPNTQRVRSTPFRPKRAKLYCPIMTMGVKERRNAKRNKQHDPNRYKKLIKKGTGA